MKTCFATVIYKQAKDFFEPYIESIGRQTDRDFDLLLLNDNYSKEELSELPIPPGTILVDENGKGLTIGLLRVELLLEAKRRGYNLMIIGDADDTFANTRVEEYRKSYKMDKSYAFYYNELITDKGKEVFDFIPGVVRDVRPISQGNFLGMSTTAINLDLLSIEFIESLKRGDCNIFDWYLYSRIIMDVGAGKYVEGAETIYRIHDNNEVGMTVDVQRELNVKLAHYGRLAEYPYFTKLKRLLETIDIDELDTTTTNHGYWWSNIYMEDHYEI